MSTQINIRVGQALNIATSIAIGQTLKFTTTSNLWESVERMLPEVYENLERLHKKQVNLVLNPPQEVGATFEDLKKIVTEIRNLEDVASFKKKYSNLLASLTPEQKKELKQLTKLG